MKADGSFGKMYFTCSKDLDYFTNVLKYNKFNVPNHFYEIVNQALNPYIKLWFDIDGNPELYTEAEIENVIHMLIKETIKVLNDYTAKEISDKDFQVTTSKNQTKYSYHVVLNRVCFPYDHIKKLFDKIIANVPVKDSNTIDSRVYSTTQNIRMFGSSKLKDKTRVKILDKNFKAYTPLDDTEYEIFKDSLIGNIYDCDRIEIPEFNQIPEDKGVIIKDIGEIDQDLLKDKIESTFDKGLFTSIRQDSSNPNKFWLTGSKHYHTEHSCGLCNRIHENMNPSVVVKGKEQSIYWYCNRSEGWKGICCGCLKPKLIPKRLKVPLDQRMVKFNITKKK